MSETVFHEAPSVELLRWLVRGSLKQHLLRAIRLWVWLKFFYGEAEFQADLQSFFTYADCRDTFFTASHPKGEKIPNIHDPDCPCAKTTAQWLVEVGGISLDAWRQAIEQHQLIQREKLDALLQQRPFAVTRRSLASDLQALVDLKWLEYGATKYSRVKAFPKYPVGETDLATIAQREAYTFNFLQPDIAAIAQNLSEGKNNDSRFFLHLAYVVPKSFIDRVDDWHDLLKQIWSLDPIPPVKLTYQSARARQIVTHIVFPVCVYYAQRAVYLCGFNPDLPHGWYNYRLDKIQQLLPVDWEDRDVPAALKERYQKHELPTPEYVEQELDKAWGFDFYLPPKLLLLRFDEDFDKHYVKGTERHATFRSINYAEAVKLIEQQPPASERQQLIKILNGRSHTDAYYQAWYRDGDRNIRQRLRAWRPYCEILLPWYLRQEIATEVEQEFHFYFQS